MNLEQLQAELGMEQKITDTYINSATIWNDKQDSLIFGISDTNSVIIDGVANQNDIAIFTSSGIKVKSLTNLKSDLSLNLVENTPISLWSGSTNISTLGTLTSGTWQGTKITDTYINSASIWNNKQDSLIFTNSGLTNDNVVIINGTANVNDIAIFTSNGIKGLNTINLKNSLGIENVDNTSDLNKPISIAVQSALVTKQDKLINGIANTNNVVINSSSISNGDLAKFTAKWFRRYKHNTT